MTAIPDSPCIGLCQTDAERVCLGCGRHIDEIVEWPFADDRRREEILRLAQGRHSQRHADTNKQESSYDPTRPK